ncbi:MULTISPECIES: hypothetical protein [Pseudoalteromonas]|uniref:Uncharacterized protein n=1 Tax=Pseudoalteromonas aurantia 208 TaxID=1314867 RepID=A0ABR9EEL7_9GAMM|nr:MULTISPECIES: hypothetical protein [Pseudoalteromonas]MBE0369292.1 hypothetical protein [Pseudoalteromonas aurantia 208]MBQ4844349.1 hypothetical protein [Pseudoalteromonas sp. MMG005]
MNELQKHKLPLLFIALLVLIKFVLLPWYSWQESLYASNTLLANKVTKSALLLDNESPLEESRQLYNDAINRIKTHFFQESTSEKLKLELQKKLELLLKERTLSSNSIGWQNSYTFPNSQITKHQLSLHFSGDTQNAVAFFLDLAQLPQVLEYEAFNFNLMRQRAGGLGRVSVSVRIAFFEFKERSQ